ncbi:glycine--tRNA ligase, chloroplastic/mitochondrial 2-like [Triticum aestivum]|uniref:glycine--tRNA ligase, chloroplastic/mitochondrial 2-like n=1 Tax=Triticum aestivum TaxID=4565 RepID=UPI001D029534|nr:glycine--tRNA ligase, chloroplastic/mitochondrial 2-like [Triticum aestivum]
MRTYERDADGDRLLGVKKFGAGPKLVRSPQDYCGGLIQDSIHTKLEVDVARGWTDHLPWSHVEAGARVWKTSLRAGLRGYGVCDRLTAVLAVSNVQVETAESYLQTVEKAGIVIDMQERRAKILDDSSTLAKGVDGDFIAPDSLLQEVVNLVEAPVPILGRYDDSFLELPKDVLTTVMQKHQRYFPVTSKSTGDLLPYFITVANGSISEEVVRKGNEAVLRARYEDAKFFYKMDTQKNLSEFRGLLKSILFHEKLGTMLDKMARVENVVAELTLVLGINEGMIPLVKDAAALAMSDLATSIVMEFTSLAGIMARHYALRDGLPGEVHLLPTLKRES